ncbi:unnamed protein product [Linum trigynum]|uniref:RRM domain-containing protein n=1 Tax=Linum trigynum TaxID=586398 RepID=A0AAV2GMF3_9ROSI
MRTRNGDTAKPATASKRTPAGRKTAAKNTPVTTPDAAVKSVAPKASELEPSPAKSEQTLDEDKPPSPTAVPDSKPDQSAVEEAQVSYNADIVMMEAKPNPRTRRVVKKVVKRMKKKQLKIGTPPTPKDDSVEQALEPVKRETEEENTEVPKEDNAEQAVEPIKIETAEESSKVQKEDSAEMAAEPVKVETEEEISKVQKEDSDEMAAEPVKGETEEQSSKVQKEDSDEMETEPVKVETEDESTIVPEEDSAEKEAEPVNAVTEESTKVMTIGSKDVDSGNKEESDCINVEKSSEVKGQDHVGEVEELVIGSAEDSQPSVDSLKGSIQKAENAVDFDVSATLPANNEGKEEPGKDAEEVPKETLGGSVDDKDQCKADTVNPEGSNENKIEGGKTPSGKEVCAHDQGYGDRVGLEDPIQNECIVDDNEARAGDNAGVLEEEDKQLTAVAEERKLKKEYEIFVGGLDMDTTEEQVKKAFENVGPVVEVRMHKDFSIDKSRGYAFVRFSNKEHVKRALSEMKNPVICGKRCGTAPREDNETLFLGNICNTWTKEAIRRKLKEYGVEGVESITLVSDVQHEGRSRGFSFLEFSCRADAMLAYKRLQKPDVVFGHPERTAKVAFAEPISEPDPQIMAEVKTVFLDGLPLHWDEDHVRERLKRYGEITRIALARNMPTAKRKDFGFVDFSTHDAAIACIKGVNDAESSGENTQIKVRARLSNPAPKTQAVKGGMRGGFLIGQVGRVDTVNLQRSGRGVARGGNQFNSINHRGRGFYQRGRSQTYRVGPEDYGFNNRHDPFHGRQTAERGRGRGPIRGGYQAVGGGVPFPGPPRPNINRNWHNVNEGGPSDQVPFRRPPFSEEAFDGPHGGRRYDDPYLYPDGMHGRKRPFYMTDSEPDYAEPSRYRPRFDYPDPAVSYRGTPYHDNYPVGGDPYPHDYYGSEFRPYPPYYGRGRGYGGDYYR